MANKNARILWAVVARRQKFHPNHVSIKPGSVMGEIASIT